MTTATGEVVFDFSGLANVSPYEPDNVSYYTPERAAITSGVMHSVTAGVEAAFYWSVEKSSEDLIRVEVEAANANTDGAKFSLYIANSEGTGYRFTVVGSNGYLRALDNGSALNSSPNSSGLTYAAGSIIALEREISTNRLEVFIDGVSVTSVSLIQAYRNDTDLTAGCSVESADASKGLLSLGITGGFNAEPYVLTGHGTPQANSMMEGTQFDTTGPVYFGHISGGNPEIANPDWQYISDLQLWLTDINDIPQFNTKSTGTVTYTIPYRVESSGAEGEFDVTVNVVNDQGTDTYTQRKGSTFDVSHTLGTILNATLNGIQISINGTGTGTVNLTDTSGIATSGAYDLVLDDGVGTETYTVNLNVYGIPAATLTRNGDALGNLTDIEVEISRRSTNIQVDRQTGLTATAGVMDAPIDVSENTTLVANDVVKVDLYSPTAEYGGVYLETVALI